MRPRGGTAAGMREHVVDDDDEDGPPRLPGGKFYMTPEGHARLRAERAERRRSQAGADTAHCDRQMYGHANLDLLECRFRLAA